MTQRPHILLMHAGAGSSCGSESNAGVTLCPGNSICLNVTIDARAAEKRQSPSRFVISLASALGALVAGCGNPLPGMLLGTYQVTATAGANSCGLGAPSTYQFDVQLSETTTTSPETLYWSWLTDTRIASGALAAVSSTDASLQATLTDSQSANVDGTDGGAGPCNMVRNDTLVVTLGAGTPPGSFTGTMSYAFAAESGADCSDQLTSAGGSYDTLPCSVAYTLSATRQ